MKENETFKYRDCEYIAIKAPSDYPYGDPRKCDLCDLLIEPNVKLCLKSDCECGSCMTNNIIFKRVSSENESLNSNEEIRRLRIENECLKKENKEFRQRVANLINANKSLSSENAKLRDKLRNIYRETNKALKTVFYQNV